MYDDTVLMILCFGASCHFAIICPTISGGRLEAMISASRMGEFARHEIFASCLTFHHSHSSTLAKYFCLGQTLPTHRNAYSPYGGLFQPTITQCIRLLSGGPFTKPTPPHPGWTSSEADSNGRPAHIDDPFSEPTFTFSTTEYDEYPAPSAYGTRRHAWVHIFPEGKIHQHPERIMSYFKWGVARLILESDVCPMVLPIWHEGADQIMHESRTFPRFLPRFGKKFSLTFGEPVPDDEWAGFRERWRKLKERELKREGKDLNDSFDFLNDELRYGREARELRMEVTFAVRDQILRLRRAKGWSDEDPKARLADTYKAEGAKREGKMDDDSWVKDT